MTPTRAMIDILDKRSAAWVVDQLVKDGVWTTENHVLQIANGDIRRCSWDTGQTVLRLWKRVQRMKAER